MRVQWRKPGSEILVHIAIYLLALLVYLLVLVIRYPFPIRPVSIAVRYSFTILFPALAGLAYLAFRVGRGWSRPASLILTMVVFGCAVAGLWASGQSEDQALSGLLPWNDSTAYYVDGLRLLEGGRLDTISARRPLLPGLFSVLLWVAGRHLHVAVALLALLQAVAVYFLAREVQRTHGPAAAALTWVILFFFVRRYTGTITTEALGITFGVLGFTLLWRVAGTQQRREVFQLPAPPVSGKPLFSWLEERYILLLLGLFVLTLALMARPGALFVLPALVLWAAWQSGSEGKARFVLTIFRQRFSWFLLVTCSVVVLGGFLVNSLMFRLLAPPKATPFSNFSYILYGMAVGGKGWIQYLTDHPEVQGLTEAERSNRILQLALEEIQRHPGNLLQGAVKQYQLLFSESYYSLYSFVTWENGWISRVVQWALYALCLIGIVVWLRSLRKRSSPSPNSTSVSPPGLKYSIYDEESRRMVLLVLTGLGFLLSVPFAPPMDANRMRVYAATIPFLALLPAVGLTALIRIAQPWLDKTRIFKGLLKRFPKVECSRQGDVPPEKGLRPKDMGHQWDAMVWFTVAVVLLTLFGPLTIRLAARPTSISEVACPAGLQPIYLRFVPGTYINMIREEVLYLDWVPVIHESRFKLWLHNTGNITTIKEFETIEPPATILVGLDLKTGKRVWLVANTELMPEKPGILAICGSKEDDSMFFKAQSIVRLGPP